MDGWPEIRPDCDASPSIIELWSIYRGETDITLALYRSPNAVCGSLAATPSGYRPLAMMVSEPFLTERRSTSKVASSQVPLDLPVPIRYFSETRMIRILFIDCRKLRPPEHTGLLSRVQCVTTSIISQPGIFQRSIQIPFLSDRPAYLPTRVFWNTLKSAVR